MTNQLFRRVTTHLRHTLDVADLGGLPDGDLLARFREHRDRAALEAIVRRHGPRVLAACRGVLRDQADAEDAFQATFVILLQRAPTIKNGRALGPWLSGVAHRVALRAHVERARRVRIEARSPAKREHELDLSWPEACTILHEELDRLPEPHRYPLILCYLQGLTRDEAATELGRTVASVKKSLERGRDVLRRRLKKRGVTLSAGLLAAVAGPAIGLSPGLVQAAVGSVTTPTPSIAALARATAPTLPWKAAGACLAASILVVGVALGFPKGEEPAKTPAAKAKPAAKAEKLPDVIAYAGTVTGPDGKPVKGAKLWLTLHGEDKLRPMGESGADGKFAFELKRSELTPESYYETRRELWSVGTVLAQAPGKAVGWGHASVSPGYDIPVQLLADDTPVDGRVRNLEGRPVVGATVRVVGLYRPKGIDVELFYDDVKAGKLSQQLLYDHLINFIGDDVKDGKLNPLYPPVTTGKDGTFTFKGLGKERVTLLRIEGEGIETEDVLVMTRPGETVLARPPAPPRGEAQFVGLRILDGRYTVHGSRFDHAAAPSRPIAGVVRDVDTGKPVAGAVITLQTIGGDSLTLPVRLRAKADAEGRYALSGAPVRKRCTLRVEGPADQPYLTASVDVPNPAGGGPIAVDAKLKRGIWATVQVIDKTDKTAVGAEIDYFVMADNPHLKGVPDIRLVRSRRARVDDLSHRIAVLPGPGILAARVTSLQHPYVSLVSPRAVPIATLPYPFRRQDYMGHVKIDPAADAKEVKCEIGLTRGTDE